MSPHLLRLMGEMWLVGTVLAPRMGVTYDPLGGGRSRVWVSMGRSFALLPAGLGSTVLSRDRYVDNISSPFGEARPTGQDEVEVLAGLNPGEIVVAAGVQALRPGQKVRLLETQP